MLKSFILLSIVLQHLYQHYGQIKDLKKNCNVFGGHLTSMNIPFNISLQNEEEYLCILLFEKRDLTLTNPHKIRPNFKD